ncbi:MAG: hemerythrin [Oceanospirillaceae bacterium]|nr:hemerythrin [Oceanospirillaceae bacterium]|tara:strand:+ start:338 stop:745 length:408 start_codon:yes stop_codon:yes gene_type:complete
METSHTLAPALGNPEIDSDHANFEQLLHQVLEASNAEFPALFRQLADEVKAHFERENQLMEESQYPAIAEHRGEHRRVLGDFEQFLTRLDRGRINFCRAYAMETLPGWFSLHVTTMDAALVQHLKVYSDIVHEAS